MRLEEVNNRKIIQPSNFRFREVHNCKGSNEMSLEKQRGKKKKHVILN